VSTSSEGPERWASTRRARATSTRPGCGSRSWSRDISAELLDGAERILRKCEAAEVTVAWVPGAFEAPLVAKRFAASGTVDAVICLGAVIRGETAHFEYVAGETAAGITRAALDTGVPVIFGVLTVDDREQAKDRLGGKEGHKGEEAALAAIEMVALLRGLP
jgi:6,7-dimethyl-8-ribityllumazine synthase